MGEDSAPVNVRCSAIVFRGDTVLLVRRPGAEPEDWVLPGGSPRPGEVTASCARREVSEETGLGVLPSRVAFVLEATSREAGEHTIEIVFTVTEMQAGAAPRVSEPGLEPEFVPLARLHELDLRPPIAGHLRALHSRRDRPTAAYLGNVWRPKSGGDVRDG